MTEPDPIIGVILKSLANIGKAILVLAARIEKLEEQANGTSTNDRV
jgi:hypothetical protein